MEEKSLHYSVEVFVNGEYSCNLQCKTIKQVYSDIACVDARKLKDLKYSYLIFRENPSGNFYKPDTGKRFYLASTLNTVGKERPQWLVSIR